MAGVKAKWRGLNCREGKKAGRTRYKYVGRGDGASVWRELDEIQRHILPVVDE